jgi:hypothetical protein
MNERAIRITHTALMGFTTIFAIVTLGVSAYLVGQYNSAEDKDEEYPHNRVSYRDRTRLILAASVWTSFFAREY